MAAETSSSMRLSLLMLGPYQATVGQEPIAESRAKKIEALLAYLVLNAGQAHRRENLVGLLFPEIPDELARTNLRQTFTRLRRAIRDREAEPPFLLLSRESARFNSASHHFVDVTAFQEYLRGCPVHAGRRDSRCLECMKGVQRALDLYRGPFLDGFFIEDSVAFDDWLLAQRERLQAMALAAADQLAVYHERRGDYAAAEQAARQQIEIEPWREEAHQQLMRLLAYQGKRGDALRQYERLTAILLDELGLEPMPETLRLRRQIAATTGDRKHNLPPRHGQFVGRAAELAAVSEYLAGAERRLVSVIGPGGSGKTALAIEAAWRAVTLHLGPFIHGVFLVPLVGIDVPEGQARTSQPAYDPLVTAVAEALDFSPTKDPGRELCNYLNDKKLLLILDNAEHMIDAVRDFVSLLLRDAQMPKLLVTSRTRLNLGDEWLVEVPGLPVPELQAGDADPPPSGDAPQLFLQRAQRLAPELVAPGGASHCPRPAIIRICRLVQGLPLGVELAASWVRLLSCQEIADELANSLDFLQSSASDVPRRHQSLRAVFDYSWALLNDSERQVLRRLSIFSGNFDRPAAASVTGASVQSLAKLVDYSLLQRRAAPATSVPRYEFLESLRHFAAERLRSSNGELELVSEGFRRYYLDLLAGRLADLKNDNQQATVQEITLEIGNIRAAWRLAIEARDFQALGAAQESLAMFYYMRSWFAEGEANFALAGDQLAGSQADGHPQDAAAEILLAKIRAWQGWFVFLRGRIAEGWQLLHASVERFRHHETIPALAGALPYLAVATSTAGDHVAAGKLALEARQLGRQTSNIDTQAVAANVLSQICYLQGEYDQARHFGQESLALLRQSGNTWSMAFSLTNLGRAAFAAADYLQAAVYYREAIEIRQSLGDSRGHALGLLYLGDTDAKEGENTAARDAFEKSLAIFRDIGSRSGAAQALIRLGRLDEMGERPAKARRAYREALQLAHDGQAVPLQLDALQGMAQTTAAEMPSPALFAARLVAGHPATGQISRHAAVDLMAHICADTGQESVQALAPDEAAARLDEASNLLLGAVPVNSTSGRP